MASRLYSLGAFLVALGLVAYALGWDFILWLPRTVIDMLAWAPREIIAMVREAPATFGIIALGLVLMLAANILRRRKG